MDFTTKPDDEENDDPKEWGWWIATVIVVGVGTLILIVLGVWLLILRRRLLNIPPPKKCYLSSNDVKAAADSKSFLDALKEKWKQLLKYDCVECTPCKPCNIPRGIEGCPPPPHTECLDDINKWQDRLAARRAPQRFP